MNIYYFLGAALGGILFYIDSKYSKKRKLNWGAIPFFAVLFGAWVTISPEPDEYIKYFFYAASVGAAFAASRIIVGITSSAYIRYQRLQNEGSSKFTALLKTLVGTALAICLGVGFFIDIRIFFVAFVLVFVFNFIENTPQKRFLKFQKNLATSKIRSIAMGLVEVEGKITSGTEVKSQLGNRSCYGSFYYEYSISKDKEGKKSYTLQDSKTQLHDFTITDDTGSVKVICEPDYFVHIGLIPHQDFESGNRRYKEYLLESGKSYLLIGSADSENGKMVITRKAPHMLLGVSPSDYVTRWNKSAPMRRNIGVTAMIAAILIALILMTPVSYRDGYLTLYFNQISFSDSE
ncbi:hypothetical protein LDO51_10915 [Providencia alcalifaciens]|uniref:hypothetical protein n=1 Tax=Providencia alcalifaciens TaxID=126385 RepID=UPI001CE08B22|nr:hypothetical protein LDO51_10915 [Providencia alcalifaciens]